MNVAAELISWGLILAGSFFVLVGGVGVIRMPDLFTRLHAAAVTDTGGAGLVLVGLVFQAGFTLVAVKLLLILVFMWYSSPVSTYALARAALVGGEEPFRADERDLPSTARIPGMTRREGADSSAGGGSPGARADGSDGSSESRTSALSLMDRGRGS